MKTTVRLMICDLDNTLYDWVTFFSRSFYEMVDAASVILGIRNEQLLDELQVVHRQYHSSEHPFALMETSSVKRVFPGYSAEDLREVLSPAFNAFNLERSRSLRVYPGVQETLSVARDAGAFVVAHTEATVVNASYRLSMLNLSKYFAKLYAAEHHYNLHPAPERAAPIVNIPGIRVLMLHELKPDTRVLREICADAEVLPSESLYVGDNLVRDVGMSNAAGVHSAWAKYGTKYDPEDWRRLVRVTHWTQADLDEAQRSEGLFCDAVPEVTLEHSMTELLDHFRFAQPQTTAV
jgi:FMN phosphatase YigB (HAD superfamily)